jgi:cell division septation protein DedD
MEMPYMQSAGRAYNSEQKKDIYILSLDNGRLFWVVVISLLVLVFLFLLGYWIGHDTVAAMPDQYARNAPGYGDMPQQSGGTLRNELDRISFASGDRGVSGGNQRDAAADSGLLAGLNVNEGEKPRIESEGFTTKAEKNEFEAIKASKPPAAAPAKKPVVSTPPAAVAASPKPAAKSEEAAPRAPQDTGKSTSGKYMVQVASLSSRSSAENLVKTLEGKQYSASIMTTVVNGKEFFRVRVGGYDDYDAAERVVNNLRNSGDGSGSYIVQQ